MADGHAEAARKGRYVPSGHLRFLCPSLCLRTERPGLGSGVLWGQLSQLSGPPSRLWGSARELGSKQGRAVAVGFRPQHWWQAALRSGEAANWNGAESLLHSGFVPSLR